MILRCTKRLLDLLGPHSGSPEPDPEDWYANLVLIEGRKCLLLTHAATLFSVFRPGVRVGDLRSMRPLVAGVIAEALAEEGLPGDAFGDLAGGELILARTADRQVLGCMNDPVGVREHSAAEAGGLAGLDVAALNRSLHRIIHAARGYEPPIGALRARIDAG